MRRLIVFIIILAVVAGAAYYFNNRLETAETEESPTETIAPVEYLYDATDGLPNGIRIESKTGETVEAERNEDNVWVLTQPEQVEADQAAFEAAASQVSTLRILKRLSSIQPEVVGLDKPEYVIALKFTSGVERKVEIGVVTPTETGYYARGEDGKIVIVSKDAVDALLTLLTNPPYLLTKTPPPPSP